MAKADHKSTDLHLQSLDFILKLLNLSIHRIDHVILRLFLFFDSTHFLLFGIGGSSRHGYITLQFLIVLGQLPVLPNR